MDDPTPATRTHTTDLLTPAGRTWRERRAARAATRALHEQVKASHATHPSATEGEEGARPVYLPAAGEPRPRALRAWRRFTVPPHAATSATLAGAYPFLADAGLGADGMLIGVDLLTGAAFSYDPWTLYTAGVITNPNVLLAGVIGTGKSALAKSLTARSLVFGTRVYVPGDPKGEWTPLAAAVGGTTLALGPGQPTRLNPLDPPARPAGLSDGDWAAHVAARRRDLLGVLTETVLARALHPVEHTALDEALHTATSHSGGTPTLPDVVTALLHPAAGTAKQSAVLAADGRDTGHALRRLVHGDLAGLFDGPTSTRFDPTSPMVTVDCSRITGHDTLLTLVLTCASTWMEAALSDPAGGRRWIVYDEAWRVLRHPALIRRMQTQWKLSRAHGIANLMIIHRLSDLDAVGDAHSQTRALAHGLLADCSTRIVYRQETDQLPGSAAALGLTDTQTQLLPGLGLGQGLWRIHHHAHLVQHQLTPEEATLYDTTSRMRPTAVPPGAAPLTRAPVSRHAVAGRDYR